MTLGRPMTSDPSVAAMPSHPAYFAILVAITCARGVVPGAINYLFEVHTSSNVADSVSRHALSQQSANVLSLALGVWCLVAIAKSRHVLSGNFLNFALVASFPIFFLVSDLLRGTLSPAHLLDYLLALIVFAAIWACKPGLDQLKILGTAGAAVASYSILFGIFEPSHAFFGDSLGRIGGSTKALIGNDQLAGVFGHSNTLGIYVALLLPFSFLIKKVPLRLALICTMTFSIVWSSSRSSLVAVGATVIVIIVFSRLGDTTRRALSTLIFIVILGAIALIPMLTTDPAAFTRRGAIWIGSFEEWARNPLFGSGLEWYSAVAQFRNDLGLQASSGHNLFVSWLVSGGLALAGLGTWFVAYLTRRASQVQMTKHFAAVTGFMTMLLVISLFEYIWVFSPNGELFLPVGFTLAALLWATNRNSTAGTEVVYASPNITSRVG